MWKTFQHNSDLYLIKSVKIGDNHQIYLNDLKDVWLQTLSENTILDQFQQNNPLIDVKIDEAVFHIENLLNNIKESCIEIEKSLEKIELLLKSNEADCQICFKFVLNKSTQDLFLKEMTVPLIQTVKYLEDQQKMLCNLIKKKDRELEEYRLEKGEISRNDLITDKFDENQINNNTDNRAMLNIFKEQSFWNKFMEIYGTLSLNLIDVKPDPWNHRKHKRIVYSKKTCKNRRPGVNFKMKN